LQEVYHSGQLLLPLQHNKDIRAIRAVQAHVKQQQQPQSKHSTSNTAATAGNGSSSSMTGADHPTAQQLNPSSAARSSIPASTRLCNSLPAGTSNTFRSSGTQDAAAAVEQLLALDSPVNAAAVATACKGLGFSLVLRDMPKRSRVVAELVGALEEQLGLPAGANLYYTPTGVLCYQLWLERARF
jgi:hypothetical protein